MPIEQADNTRVVLKKPVAPMSVLAQEFQDAYKYVTRYRDSPGFYQRFHNAQAQNNIPNENEPLYARRGTRLVKRNSK